MGKKTDKIIRIGFNNINGFHTEGFQASNLRTFIVAHEFDIFGMCEVNTHWKHSNVHIQDITRGWFQRLHCSSSYYAQYPVPSKFQSGGVMQFVTNRYTSKIATSGGDDQGRWTWQVLRGKDQRIIRVVSAYRPVKNEINAGSAWNQQQTYGDIHNLNGTPHTRWLDDLSRLVQQWLCQGESLIVMVDLNDDVKKGKTAKALNRMGLREIISDKHQDLEATFHRGSLSIDGIFVSSEIQPVRCGYASSISDHLCLWVDLDEEVLFGTSNAGPIAKSMRRLQCSDPRTVERYTSYMYDEIMKRKIHIHAATLDNDKTTYTHAEAQVWEKIDRTLLQLRLRAERKCRKLHTGYVQWTPELSILNATKRFWYLANKKVSGLKVDTKYFKRVARVANQNPLILGRSDIISEKLQEATEKVREYKRTHVDKRNSWLEGLASAMAHNEAKEDDDIDVKTVSYMKLLKHREDQRTGARIIRRVTGDGTSFQSLDHVVFDNDQGIQEVTWEQQTMEMQLLKENQVRFNQAALSPFLQEPLNGVVGKYGETQASKRILCANNDMINENRPMVREVLDAMASPPGMSKLALDLSVESFVNGWLKAKEHTASGKSGLHFGHFIAACKHHELKLVECQMANFPLRTGYSPQRWQQGVEVMLLKQRDNFHVKKLRAILLFEADFNFNNKRLGRQLMWHAENHNWIAPEQYGSRKGFSAIDHCLNKRLSFDILRQSQQSGAICINDMKGCYDRIVHSVASICLQRFGMPVEPIKMMFHTLQSLKHYVRTACGMSSKFFNAKDIHPVAIQGIGQGNGAGPQVWAAISSVLLDVLRKKNLGAQFRTPISQTSIQLVGYAYVDDTDLIVTAEEDNHNSVIDRMQQCLDTWEQAIDTTGGQLEPSKTYWYLIHFIWRDGKWKYALTGESAANLWMTNATRQRVQVERVEVSEARRTLGVRLAPDGNNRVEAAYLKQQCDQWADRLRCGMIPKKYAWRAFSSTIWPKVAYALPATTFSRTECDRITKKMIAATLSATGVNQHMNRDLVFGDISRQGLGYPDLYVWQGAEALSRFLKFMQVPGHLTNHLLTTSYEALQMETGFILPFVADYNRWKASVTDCFLVSLWKFLSEFNITVRGPNKLGRGLRNGDSPIMELIASEMDGHNLQAFNRCRKFLKVFWVSEIVTGDGRFINWYATKGEANPFPFNTWKWPREIQPTRADWNIWQWGLNKLGQHTREGKIRLHQPLGTWLETSSCVWFYDPTCQRIYNRITKEIYVHKRGRPTRQAISCFTLAKDYNDDFSLKYGATVIQRKGYLQMESHAEIDSDISQESSDFRQFLNKHPQWDWWSKQVQVDINALATITEDLRNGDVLAVSDGSYKDQKGTAAIVVEGKRSGCRITSVVQVPGDKDAQCAYRSEAAGILAAVQIVEAMARYANLEKGEVLMCCDGQSALRQSFSKTVNVSTAHFDIINTTQAVLRQSVLKWNTLHVRGHQTVFPLEREAALNEEMDLRCKDYWEKADWSNIPWFHMEWQVFITNRCLSSNLAQEIRQHCSIVRAEKYWNGKSLLAQDDIDWDVLKLANKAATRARRTWITKHSSGFCSVGIMAKRMGLRPTDECPRCSEPETAEHVWTCKSEEATVLWNQCMEGLQQHMEERQTDPEIRAKILEGLKCWREGSKISNEAQSSAQSVAVLQEDIGWKHFFEGRHHCMWRQLQSEYFQTIRSLKSSKRWSTAIIKKLWEIAWDLWEQRNGRLHHKEEGHVMAETEIQIQNLWTDQRIRQTPSIRKLLPGKVEELLAKSVQQRQQWLIRVETALSRNQTTPTFRYDGERRRMRQYLGS
jgi:hypothetical protein